MGHIEKKEQQPEERERKYVTRKEFYIGMAVILVAMFWNGGRQLNRMEHIANQFPQNVNNWYNSLSGQINSIPRDIKAAMEEADNPLLEQRMEIINVDLKQKMATVKMTATPKEYVQGMEAQFFLTCDKREPVSVFGTMAEDRTFSAELKIPFCAEATGRVVLIGDTQQVQMFDTLYVENEVLPVMSGYWSGSSTVNASQPEQVLLDGGFYVDVQKPEWMPKSEAFVLKDAKTEIQVDGKAVLSVPMKREDTGDPLLQNYYGEIEGTIALKKNQRAAYIFTAKDSNGLTYHFLIEEAYFSGNDFTTEVSVEPQEQNRLRIE